MNLSAIARYLEEDIPLHRTETRLSRNLDAEGMDRVLTDGLIRTGSRRVQKDTLLIMDTSDISKQHVRGMEYLVRLRDGNTGDKVSTVAKRFFGIPPFHYDALAGGIAAGPGSRRGTTLRCSQKTGHGLATASSL